jgi:hypothetical protein
MYRSGFTVGDGPYRLLSDEANREFLQALATGRIPTEFLLTDDEKTRVKGGDIRAANINVRLKDKREEEYQPPDYVAFSGGGNTMGSATASTEDAEAAKVKTHQNAFFFFSVLYNFSKSATNSSIISPLTHTYIPPLLSFKCYYYAKCIHFFQTPSSSIFINF